MTSMFRRPTPPALLLLGLLLFGLLVWVVLDRGERSPGEGVGRSVEEPKAGLQRTTEIAAPVLHAAPLEGAELAEPSESGRELVEADLRAQLELRFVHVETGEPVSGEIDLWRLGVPADEEWTAGDVRIGEVDLEDGRAVFDDLIPGAYRVEALMQRRKAASLLAFEVEAGSNALTFDVDPAARRDVQLEVLGVDGALFTGKVEFYDRGSTMSFSGSRVPDWATPRVLKAPADEYAIGIGGAGGGYYMTSHRTWREHEREPLGFVLKRLRESSRELTYVHKWRMRLERVMPVPVLGTWSIAEARAFTGNENVGFDGPDDGSGGLSEIEARGQRWVCDVRIRDTGADAYVVVAVDPLDLVRRIEGVEGFTELEVFEGLAVELIAASADEAPMEPQVVLALTLDGEVVLRSRWYPLKEPLPRLIARATQD